MTVAGIDPGLKGGITILNEEGVVASIPMPTMSAGKKNLVDGLAVSDFLRSYKIDLVVVELVHTMPKQGIASAFSFGHGCGMIEGILITLQLPYKLVTPQAWMKDVLKGLPKNVDVKGSIVWCQRSYPNVDWRGTERSRINHDGKTDSACLAYYGLKNGL